MSIKWLIGSGVFHIVLIFVFQIRMGSKGSQPVPVNIIRIQDFHPQAAVAESAGDIQEVKQKVIETNVTKTQDVYPSGPTNFYPFYMVDSMPSAIGDIDPPYPAEARKLGIEGKVVLLADIDEKGIVRHIRIESSPHPSLSQSASNAVFCTKFVPAKINGICQPVEVRLTLNFKLE
jgi:TonB family protein